MIKMPFFTSFPPSGKVPLEPKPRFGCRLLAYIAPNQHKGQDVFLKQALLDGGNSLLKQSQRPYSYEADTPTEKADPNFSLKDYCENGIPYQLGWGFAFALDDMSQSLFAKASAAALDKKFLDETAALAQKRPCNLLAHLRQVVSIDNGAIPANVHPFQINDWALAHVGAVPVDVLATMRNRLENAHAQDNAVQLPTGDTDSEALACYLALKLREETGDDASMSIPPVALEQVLKDVMAEIILNPQKLSDEEIAQTMRNGFQGATRNSTNVIAFINNRQLLIGKVIPTYKAVFVGTHHQANGDLSYLVSHHPMHLELPANERIDWKPLPNDTITSFLRVSKSEETPVQSAQKPEHIIFERVIPLPVRSNRQAEVLQDAQQVQRVIERLEAEDGAQN